MKTKEFRQYLIHYFEKKEKNRLYILYKIEYESQKYSRRRRIAED
jgi:hypothetical protein